MLGLLASRLRVVLCWIVALAVPRAVESSVIPEGVHQHDVLPVMLLRCTVCHGARKQEGGLDLRSPAGMKRGGRSGPALVGGDPDRSLMIRRIESEACPPGDQLLKYFVRRPTGSEVAKLREWIAAGAPVRDVPEDVATREPDPLVTDQDRSHWAFRPPVKPGQGDSVDDFIRAGLLARDLDFAPEADRDTLIRRAAFDLTGLPPDLADWERWRTDSRPDWFRHVVDELLASPRYGERWGRYWLDVAGYADSEGGVSADPIRPVAWKYRDYVIAAFNQDKPYDRFLLEQLAGDELLDYENVAEITEEMVNNLVATGFLRMGIDQTGSRTMNFVPERLGVIADAITVVGSGLMGLTMDCARCHSHKYDPIPHRDYYRLKAVFQGALDEHDWLSFKTRRLKVATAAHREKVARVNPPLEKRIRSLESSLKKEIASEQLAALEHYAPELDDTDRRDTLDALRKADNQRTLRQRNLVEILQRALLEPESGQSGSVMASRRRQEELRREIIELQRRLEPPLEIRALWDRGEPSPTYLLARGEHDKPADLVGPGVPSVLTDGVTPFESTPPFPGGPSKTGRRLAFARWLIRPDHPLTTRVMVNRVWRHHFGRGLVASLENFGVKGERPSHPGLLDWLAVEFVERGWSVKELHRLIMNSRAYRQSSRITERMDERDPQNRWLSRMPMRRMDAEALRDSLLSVAGRLSEQGGGPPDPVSVDREGQVSAVPLADGRWRRSVFLQYRRTEIPTMMDAFDYPEMGPNCVDRNVSVVSPQALLLLNNGRVRQLAAFFAGRVREAAGSASATRVETAYRIALSRSPGPEELVAALAALRELTTAWSGDEERALETFCHQLLNSAAFVHVD